MNNRIETPKFASEEEEALRRARDAANALTIHLPDADLAAIRHLAAQRGRNEDVCAASSLHRALESETPGPAAGRH